MGSAFSLSLEQFLQHAVHSGVGSFAVASVQQFLEHVVRSGAGSFAVACLLFVQQFFQAMGLFAVAWLHSDQQFLEHVIHYGVGSFALAWPLLFQQTQIPAFVVLLAKALDVVRLSGLANC